MNTITERFGVRIRGYDRKQVQSYIQMLSGEYDKLQKQYAELLTQSVTNIEVISKVLVDAEMNANKIIADAKDEAEKIVGSASVELRELQQHKSDLIAEINSIANKSYSLVPAMA